MELDQACPSCGNAMQSGAVLCTACGFHTVTGKRLAVDVGYARKTNKSTGTPSAASRALVALIKPAMIIIILGGIGYVGWRACRWLGEDPAAKQRAAVAKMKVGMTVQQLVDAVGEEPTTVYKYVPTPHKTNDGEKEITITTNDPVRINYLPDFMTVYKGELNEGFYFIYSFFSGGKYQISFNPGGIVTDIDDVSGLASLPR